MNDDYSFFTARRKFVKGTGSLVALGSLPAYLTASTEELNATLNELKQTQGLVLYRESDTHSIAFADMLSRAGLKAVALTDDLVRQWRDGLGNLARKAGVPILGLTNWPDYLIINGLAAEQKKRVQLELQHSVVQSGKENWSASLALDYMHLPLEADKKTIQNLAKEYQGEHTIKPNTSTLFSWLIA